MPLSCRTRIELIQSCTLLQGLSRETLYWSIARKPLQFGRIHLAHSSRECVIWCDCSCRAIWRVWELFRNEFKLNLVLGSELKMLKSIDLHKYTYTNTKPYIVKINRKRHGYSQTYCDTAEYIAICGFKYIDKSKIVYAYGCLHTYFSRFIPAIVKSLSHSHKHMHTCTHIFMYKFTHI